MSKKSLLSPACVLAFGLAIPSILSFSIPGQRTHTTWTSASETTPVLVAAAADLQYAMDSLIHAFIQDNPGAAVQATYGSSGNFFAQITHGAPFDLFFSADMDYPRKLAEQKLALGPVRPYAVGQIVLWSKRLDPSQEKMNTLLNSAVGKIAMANPAHAPYGKRAQESLLYYKLYDRVRDRLILGENISQTAQYAASGAADIGIIALSLARSPAMQREGGKFWEIPAGSHQPMQQGCILLQHAKGNETARKFLDFMFKPRAVSILNDFGLDD
ncbi:MAG: molybdate ABC transporter substrate-binding protein [Bacteroidota bacterium]|nr:molybdate ABC transporter substrate-binding protein [Bacteroidota bacterium]MDP4217691.1 molybdate ABC transporter substrate-binding protein [Bacteroidota bacterium]MDP4247741.1 molybdate ABC transporter substrate-binding protein [Bacteroidota bacterium]MDP4255651.1 molybdate ABC transporter substrate-binding protein [Bacteroidota bacterium]MDP4260170.1 molybdate ABC transporter substrate-binding protein [Bacteroidota bacterium]